MVDDYDIGYLDEPRSRCTTVHSRYHVGCDYCGLVEAYQRKADAWSRAERHKHDGHHVDRKVTVFDSMAHKGHADLWEVL